jgi:hypothetical protein
MTAPKSSPVPAHELVAPRKMTPLLTWISSGFRCALVRAPLYGAINGYVRVPGIEHEHAEQVEVHGGVTYGPDDDGWIGFDTLHAGDIWPDVPASLRHIDRGWGRTWTEEQVAAEAERMAASAKAVMEQ